MVRFKNILFPTDLTPNSQKVVSFVKLMAERFQAQVIVVYVFRGLETFGFLTLDADDYTESLNSYEKEIQDQAEKRLESFVTEQMSGLSEVTFKLLQGDPADEILAAVKEFGSDLIIMGSHGRKGLEKIMFGSVAQAIISRSSCPVMTVNPYLVKV